MSCTEVIDPCNDRILGLYLRTLCHFPFQAKANISEDIVQSLVSICQTIIRTAPDSRSPIINTVKHFLRNYTLKQEQKSKVVHLSSAEDLLQGTVMFWYLDVDFCRSYIAKLSFSQSYDMWTWTQNAPDWLYWLRFFVIPVVPPDTLKWAIVDCVSVVYFIMSALIWTVCHWMVGRLADSIHLFPTTLYSIILPHDYCMTYANVECH